MGFSIMAALTAITAGANIAEGFFGMQAADAQARGIRSQLSLMRAESEADIARYAESAQGLRAEQSVRYLKSGVTLEGSPLEILDETARVSAENISAMRAKTTADIRSAKGKALAIRNQGRAAMVGGVAKAAALYASQARKLPKTKESDPIKTTGSSPRDLKIQRGMGFGASTNLDLDRKFF